MSSHMLNSYITLARKLKTDSYFKSSDALYNPAYYDVWLCPKGITFSGVNGINESLYSLSTGKNPVLSEDYMTHLGMLGNLHLETIDDDSMPSERTYQELFDLPVSAYMFSKSECTSTVFKQDPCYPNYDYSVYDKKLHYDAHGDDYFKNSGTTTNWKNRQIYFQTEYNFSSGFKPEEYIRYSGPKDYLYENNTVLMSDTVSMNTDVHNSQGGALLVTWYSGARVANISADYVNTISKCDTLEHTKTWSACSGTYMLTSARPVNAFTKETPAIPCIYYEMPLTYKLKNAVVNIQWSENGLYTFS